MTPPLTWPSHSLEPDADGEQGLAVGSRGHEARRPDRERPEGFILCTRIGRMG
jgi:hypothetical protein